VEEGDRSNLRSNLRLDWSEGHERAQKRAERATCDVQQTHFQSISASGEEVVRMTESRMIDDWPDYDVRTTPTGLYSQAHTAGLS
jgi:hypothetical protein